MRSPSDDFHWSRSNGRPRTSGIGQDVAQRIIRRAANYVMAPFGILLITLVAVVFNAIFGIPPFLFFGLGVCIFPVTAGAGPALVSVLLAILLSDFFLVGNNCENADLWIDDDIIHEADLAKCCFKVYGFTLK